MNGYPTDEARRARALIYPLGQTTDRLWRWAMRTSVVPRTAAADALLQASEALGRAESAARRFPINPTGL